MRQFRKGDIVTIECVVESQFTEQDLRVRPVQGHTDIYVAPDQVKIVRQAISVGDFVSEDGSDITKGTVIAIHNNSAWVQFSDLSGYSTFELDELCRVERVKVQVAS